MFKVSIIIPAFNNPQFLTRTINSILIQSYLNYEIIISDDTQDDSIKDVIKEKYSHLSNLFYIKNNSTLGPSRNWNNALSYATGDLIKMLHHDDWFSSKDSLQDFIEPLNQNPSINFAFCISQHYIGETYINSHIPDNSDINTFLSDPFYILRNNFIGSPSATIHKKSDLFYDENLKWFVDCEFYLRFLKGSAFYFIEKSLININITEGRLSDECKNNLTIISDETEYLNKKYNL